MKTFYYFVGNDRTLYTRDADTHDEIVRELCADAFNSTTSEMLEESIRIFDNKDSKYPIEYDTKTYLQVDLKQKPIDINVVKEATKYNINGFITKFHENYEDAIIEYMGEISTDEVVTFDTGYTCYNAQYINGTVDVWITSNKL